jgi:hypothetical protein
MVKEFYLRRWSLPLTAKDGGLTWGAVIFGVL